MNAEHGFEQWAQARAHSQAHRHTFSVRGSLSNQEREFRYQVKGIAELPTGAERCNHKMERSRFEKYDHSLLCPVSRAEERAFGCLTSASQHASETMVVPRGGTRGRGLSQKCAVLMLCGMVLSADRARSILGHARAHSTRGRTPRDFSSETSRLPRGRATDPGSRARCPCPPLPVDRGS